MRSTVSRLMLYILCCALAAGPAWAIPWSAFRPIAIVSEGQDKNARSYQSVFEAVGLSVRTLQPQELSGALAARHQVLVVPEKTARRLAAEQMRAIVELARGGMVVVTEGESPLARSLGIRFPKNQSVPVSGEQDLLFPSIQIGWEIPADMKPFLAPTAARVYSTTKPGGRPLVVSFPVERGRCVYLGLELDPLTGDGHTRFPYFLHALMREGRLVLPFRGPRLETLFDYGFRYDANLGELARQWRANGFRAIHVGTWHFYDRDHDEYLRNLIRACHNNGILVYAWLELPEVSHSFWLRHPEWREKNALLEDAPALWREVMNLLDPDCFREVATTTAKLLEDFDWDGVNLCELYYEGPDGPRRPYDFTPMNDLVRAEFRRQTGFDPAGFFQPGPGEWAVNPLWSRFVEYRADLVQQHHEKWLRVIGAVKAGKPHLDVLVTAIDNLYQPQMKEACGCDVERILRLMPQHHFRLVVEDPDAVWHLEPLRYRTIGEIYASRISDPLKLGVDINVVDRPSVTPTAKPTGVEVLRQFYYAGKYFEKVVLYIDNTVNRQDLPLLSRAMVGAPKVEVAGDTLRVTSDRALLVSVGESKAITVDGQPCPFLYNGEALIPAGTHQISSSATEAGLAKLRVHRLNAELRSGALTRDGVRFSYASETRAIAVLNALPAAVEVDGQPYAPAAVKTSSGEFSVMLPPGTHEVFVRSTQ